ncbi:MAG: DUF1501 domain-containing protein [Planctomycetes bacterium]|nr:DUF1501 domain-containing protein [Planctomycetota bacterium]
MFPSQSRRDFFFAGGTGIFGLTMPGLLKARAAAPAKKAKADHVIVVWLGGGPPHQDMFDLKPNAPAEIRGEYKPIDTNVPGIQIGELLPRLAKNADKYTILRSVGINSEKWEHGGGQYWLTGNPRKTGVTPAYPMYGNVVAKLRPAPKDVPTFVAFGDIDNHAYGLKQNYLGPTVDPIVFQPDDAKSEVKGMLVPPVGLELSAFDRRETLRQSLDTQLRGLDDPLVGGMDKFQQTAFDLLRSPKLRTALEIEREPIKVAERYGKNSHGKRVLAARRLVEAGVPFVYTHFESNWDHHGQNFRACKDKLPVLDKAVASLLEDLSATGMLERTIVMVLGEMGRTPKINKDAGRDHWGTCQSVLVAGGGFAGGTVVGATDKHAAYVVDKYYPVESFGRTIYHQLGIDPDQTLYALDNRPHRLIGEDTPLIKEAIA